MIPICPPPDWCLIKILALLLCQNTIWTLTSRGPTAANKAVPHKRPPSQQCAPTVCWNRGEHPPPTVSPTVWASPPLHPPQPTGTFGKKKLGSGGPLSRRGWENRSMSAVRATGRGEQRSSGSPIPRRSGRKNESLCCWKTKAVMMALDWNVRSLGAVRKREIHQSFSFINY